MAHCEPYGTPGDKSIGLPIVGENDYAPLVEDRDRFCDYLDQKSAQHSELFSVEIAGGDRFHSVVISMRQGIKTRRIRLPQSNAVDSIRSDFVTPYLMKPKIKQVRPFICLNMESPMAELPTFWKPIGIR